MDNVVKLGSGRPKPRRANDVPQSGARILFFTGVRYCRDDAPFMAPPEARDYRDHIRASELGLSFDLAAH